MTVRVPIEDACELVTDGTHFTPPNVGIGVPFLTVKDVNGSGLDFLNCSFITEADFKTAQDGNSAPCPGDVLFSKDGTVGKVHVVTTTKPFAVLSSLAILRPNPTKVDSRYLGQVLRFPAVLNDAIKRKTGSAIRRIVLADLKQVEIPLPSIPEQRRIAAILDKADELRAKRRAALQQLSGLARAIFVEMFGDPVLNRKGWHVLPLGKVGTVDRGVSKHRPRNAPELLNGPYPLVQTGDVANCDGYIRDFNSTYSEVGLRQSKLWKAGTLCITIAANIAKTGVLTFDACFPDSVVGFQANDPATVEYVRAWLSFLQIRLEEAAPESAQKNINLGLLRNLLVPVPPMEMQRIFANRVEQIERVRQSQRKAVTMNDAFFASLQQRAFNGAL